MVIPGTRLEENMISVSPNKLKKMENTIKEEISIKFVRDVCKNWADVTIRHDMSSYSSWSDDTENREAPSYAHATKEMKRTVLASRVLAR